MAAMVCHIIKERFPGVRINCITQNPTLLDGDPAIEQINARQSFCYVHFWYQGVIAKKSGTENVLKETLDLLGINHYQFKARVYLFDQEINTARQLILKLRQPIITFNVLSKEKVKMWPWEKWRALLQKLLPHASLVQLGDEHEPVFEGVLRFAGKLSLRESMAVLAQARLHIGPDSFLMHAANGLDVPSVIIFGGSRTPDNSGYADNINLATHPVCSPCWLHDSRGDQCPYDVQCMKSISVEQVKDAVDKLLSEIERKAHHV